MEIFIITRVIYYRAKNDVYRTKEYYEYALDFLAKNGYQKYYEFRTCLFKLYKSTYLSLKNTDSLKSNCL